MATICLRKWKIPARFARQLLGVSGISNMNKLDNIIYIKRWSFVQFWIGEKKDEIELIHGNSFKCYEKKDIIEIDKESLLPFKDKKAALVRN